MWGKNKLVNKIEFIALDKHSFEVCPKPFPASQAIPDWWKNASPYIKNSENNQIIIVDSKKEYYFRLDEKRKNCKNYKKTN